MSYEEIRLPSPIPARRRRTRDPGARARADAGDGRAAVDPARPDPLQRRRRGFTVETATGTVVLAGEVAAHVAGRTTRAAKQHVADRLVAVAVG